MPNSAFALTSWSGTFLSVDDAFCDIVQRSRCEVSILDLTFKLDRGGNAAKLDHLRTTGEPFSIRKHYLRPDGGIIGVHNTVAALTDGNGGLKLVAAVNANPCSSDPDTSPEALLDIARAIFGERLLRLERWDCDWTQGPSWDLVLITYITEAEGKSSSRNDIIERVGISTDLGHAIIDELVRIRVLEVEDCRTDQIIHGVRLSRSCVAALEGHLRSLCS